MNFPAEVAELIMDRCQHISTLASCSLVCRAWHPRAKFWLFAAPIKVVGVPDIEAFVTTLQHPLCTLHPYIHSLSIRQSSSNPSLLNHVIPVLARLSNLTSLEIVAENALLSDESRTIFRSNFRAIRHLLLRMTFSTCADAADLVSSFPLLESLHLYARWIGSASSPASSLPVGLHTLDIDGFLKDALGWLLSYPPSPALSSVQLREVVARELEIVIQYVRFVAATLKSFKLSFLDVRAESEFLGSRLDVIRTPELRVLEITGRDCNDAALIVHMLSSLEAPLLEELSFTNLISVNPRQFAWAQLEHRLCSPAYVHLRKVTITTLPHLRPGIRSQLQRLHDRDLLDFVFPQGLR
ncbi:hypothetical protein DFH07DRAFT_952995 [Mycena maculata]|uniref:F-box domain-containing protein n=1 Tax=Mycena maculata TaxID=230809 RepID=A0AAD7JXD7_9AGAR|nr:hypothetical protein DFH07DRAFT_952995 [Mycena maculata]